jgi:hypothetical protein
MVFPKTICSKNIGKRVKAAPPRPAGLKPAAPVASAARKNRRNRLKPTAAPDKKKT